MTGPADAHADRCPVATGEAECEHGCRCPDVQVSQRRDESTADCARRNGWGPGTILVGCEGYGDTVIEVTAVGKSAVLARALSHRGRPYEPPRESSWTLSCRDWRPSEDPR